MSEAKHTPRLWRWNGTKQKPNHNLYLQSEHSIILYSISHVDTANARLIAAAPELLEACKRLESFASGFEDDKAQEHRSVRYILSLARAAIAKAEGRQ